MDDQRFQWLKEDIASIDERLNKRLYSMETKIDEILKFKWQIIGGSLVLSTILTFAMNLLLKK